jgi:AcrR family transcriptional regulator
VNDPGAIPRRPRLTRAEAKARTREQLLDAATRVFARKGYAGASVEEIAEAAGYSIGALYSNFASKEQLFLELMSARGERRVSEVSSILDAEDPVDALARLLERSAGRDPDLMALRAEFWLYAVRNPDAMGALTAQRRQQVDALMGVISAATERWGTPPEVPAAEVATLVLAMFQGLVRQRRIDPDRVSGDLFGQGLRWLFGGLRATSGQQTTSGQRAAAPGLPGQAQPGAVPGPER